MALLFYIPTSQLQDLWTLPASASGQASELSAVWEKHISRARCLLTLQEYVAALSPLSVFFVDSFPCPRWPVHVIMPIIMPQSLYHWTHFCFSLFLAQMLFLTSQRVKNENLKSHICFHASFPNCLLSPHQGTPVAFLKVASPACAMDPMGLITHTVSGRELPVWSLGLPYLVYIRMPSESVYRWKTKA